MPTSTGHQSPSVKSLSYFIRPACSHFLSRVNSYCKVNLGWRVPAPFSQLSSWRPFPRSVIHRRGLGSRRIAPPPLIHRGHSTNCADHIVVSPRKGFLSPLRHYYGDGQSC